MSDRERWSNQAYLIQPDGELHRLAFSLDDVEAQLKTMRDTVGGPPEAVHVDDGTVWLYGARDTRPNAIASMLAGCDVQGAAVFTGRDKQGRIASLTALAVRRLWEASERFQRGETDTSQS